MLRRKNRTTLWGLTKMNLSRELARLSAELQRERWKLSRIMRPAIVREYDPDTHTTRAQINPEGSKGGMSPKKTKIMESSGKQTSRHTLTEGQTGWLFCPNGDMRQAQFIAGNFSDNFRPSSNAPQEIRHEIEETFASAKPDEYRIKAKKIILEGDVYLGEEGGERVLTVGGPATKAWAV